MSSGISFQIWITSGPSRGKLKAQDFADFCAAVSKFVGVVDPYLGIVRSFLPGAVVVAGDDPVGYVLEPTQRADVVLC